MLITFFFALFRPHLPLPLVHTRSKVPHSWMALMNFSTKERLALVVREVQLVEARVSNGEGLRAPLVLHTNPEAREEARGGQRWRPRAKYEGAAEIFQAELLHGQRQPGRDAALLGVAVEPERAWPRGPGRETAAGSKHRLGWRYAKSKRPPQTSHEAKAPLQG